MKDGIEAFDEKIGKIMANVLENAIASEPRDRLLGNGLTLEFATEKEKGQDKIFFEYMDLKNTYESIKNCLIYINSFPFSRKIAKVEYLKFIYSAYLNEIYILQTRIKKLTTMIYRCLRSHKNDCEFKNDYKKLLAITEWTSKCFDSLVEVRGEHVHKKRYDTAEMNKVAAYEFVFSKDFQNSEDMAKIVKYSTGLLKLEYKEKMQNNQEAITAIINKYMEEVKEFLFDKDYINKVVYCQEKRY